MGYKDPGVHWAGRPNPLHGRFQGAKFNYMRKFQKCILVQPSNHSYVAAAGIGVARLERGISTHILHPPLSALRSRKRRTTLPLALKGAIGGAVFRFQDQAVCGLRIQSI